MKTRWSRPFVAGIICCLPCLSWAADPPQRSSGTASGSSKSGGAGNDASDLTSLSLEELLNTAVITGSKFSENLTETPGIVSVVSQDELQRFGGLTLGEVLNRVPGLNITRSYFSDGRLVAARGDQTRGNGGHILFLINGRPTREVMEGGLITDLVEAFPLAAIERIEVIKGPGSVLYGSNAYSGVVNLITKKVTGNTLSVTALGGAEGARHVSGSAMYQRGELKILAAAQFHQIPDWSTEYRSPPAGGPQTPTTATSALLLGDGSTGPQTLLQRATLQSGGEGAFLGGAYKGWSFLSSFTQADAYTFNPIIGKSRWRRGFGDLGYELTANARWDMDFHVTYSRNTLKDFGPVQIGRDSNEGLFEWTNFITLTNLDRIVAGVVYNHVQGTETYFGAAPPLAIADGGWSGMTTYVQMNHQLPDNLKLVGGLQANKIGSVPANVVPRGGVIWTPTERTSFKALYSQAFRAPSIDETLLNHPYLAGNPNLSPEHVSTIDLAVSYTRQRLYVAASLFHSVHTNAIVVGPGIGRAQFANSGNAVKFNGGGLEGKYYFGKDFYAFGSLLYQRVGSGVTQYRITPIPAWSGKTGISYQAKNDWAASLVYLYDGPLPGYPEGLNPPLSGRNLVNVQMSYDLTKYGAFDRKNRIALVVHGDNVTNREVWIPNWGQTPMDTMPGVRGRTIYAGLEFSLNPQ
jgi:outer membrane receptor protein involved in Fe transport